jgi:hypothetical protein
MPTAYHTSYYFQCSGWVHLCCRVLLCAGEAVAQKRRLPGSKGFDFFVESSFVELYNETCRDLYSKSGPAGAPNLPVSNLHWALRTSMLVKSVSGGCSAGSQCARTASAHWVVRCPPLWPPLQQGISRIVPTRLCQEAQQVLLSSMQYRGFTELTT